ncbi:MAG: thioredoxin domain-containing protein [Actinomycetota bacterium]|nr:thioredoxin domain-containing protein [Actinomycetota bacterium]
MTNRLASSTSPYLLQHAQNPVDWWEWGSQALAEARRRDVPLLISVGYAACHWCHVMAHESFEDSEVAAAINAGTLPVKVDREERPDIDAVYMHATTAMTGRGGWPMTVFATPAGAPFYAGTYFAREHLLRLLAAVGEAWTHRRDEVIAQGSAVVQACASSELRPTDVSRVCPIGGPCPPVSPVDAAVLDKAADSLRSAHDTLNGGFGGPPKFPTQPALAFLLAHHRRTGDAGSLTVVSHTALRMARGGIHDQLAGGFARYSVDSSWTVPHFEKMLYDNALLLATYVQLWRATGEEFFGRVADGIARFIVDELGTPAGGFAAALDADAPGTDGASVEGASYVWTPAQLIETLGSDDGRWAAEIFGVTESGTFEAGASVLQLPDDPDDAHRFADVRARLLVARRQRPQPLRDDKVVAAWNGFAITALTGYAAARAAAWADEAADRAARLLLELHVVQGRLRRVSRNGRVGTAAGILEDHAAVTTAFLARHTSVNGGPWLAAAGALVDTMSEHFTDEFGIFSDTADDAEVLAYRRTDLTDGPTPSGTALAIDALRRIQLVIGDEVASDLAWRTLAGSSALIADHPRFAAGLATVAEDWVV